MFKIAVKGRFSAAHFVRGYKGDCASGHGHNFEVEVTVGREKLDKLGIAVDFRLLKRQLGKVLKTLDHKNLNQLPFFRRRNPTAEMIAFYIHEKLKKSVKGASLESVAVWEGDESKAVYEE